MDSNQSIATWLNKGHAQKIMTSAQAYWDNTKEWVVWAVNQKQEQHSEEPILGLLAWERLTDRLPTESSELYRKRVQHALVNTIDAGEISTITDIFSRLGIDVLKVTERIEGRDWDIIAIDFSSHTMSQYGDLMPELIQLYGRTCRRYEFAVSSVAENGVSVGWLDVQWDSFHVDLALTLDQQTNIDVEHQSALFGAQYDVHQCS